MSEKTITSYFNLDILNLAIPYHIKSYRLGNERKSEQAHIPHAPTLLENAIYNEWQFQALATAIGQKRDINCSSKGSNQHFL